MSSGFRLGFCYLLPASGKEQVLPAASVGGKDRLESGI